MRATKTMLNLNQIHCIDALAGLRKLPDECVDCVMTSPPYWALRDYGTKPLIWDGDPQCNHDFEPERLVRPTGTGATDSTRTTGGTKSRKAVRSNELIESAFCRKCSAWSGSLGLEPTIELFVRHLVSVFDEIKRVLKPTGTLWVNIGDGYAGSWASYAPHRTEERRKDLLENSSSWHRRAYDSTFRPPTSYKQTVPSKSLCLVPARFMIAMAERGWILRNDIVWHKPNHMPTSVKDRLACSWEHLLLFSKSRSYYFDLDAIREPHVTKGARLFRPGKHARARDSPHLRGNRMPPTVNDRNGLHRNGRNPGDFWTVPSETRTLGALIGTRGAVKVPGGAGWFGHGPGGQARIVREQDPRWLSPLGKNPGDSWDIATKGFRGAHFAVYPEKLCERPILAGCPAQVCAKCGMPPSKESSRRVRKGAVHSIRNTAILRCLCKATTLPGIVLDPFAGAGTTCLVAKRLGRRFIGLEMNPDYVAMARKRISYRSN